MQGLNSHASSGLAGEKSMMKRCRTTEANESDQSSSSLILHIKITYFGSNEGCTFMPPYLAPFNMRGGTKSPNDTAITKFMLPFGEDGG